MRRTVEKPEFELPLGLVTCPFCAEDLTVEELSLLETLWMHEYDCPAIMALDPETVVEPELDEVEPAAAAA